MFKMCLTYYAMLNVFQRRITTEKALLFIWLNLVNPCLNEAKITGWHRQGLTSTFKRPSVDGNGM